MAKLKLDLHDIYNDSRKLDDELNEVIQEAVRKRVALVEIIPGKGSGQLKKSVLRFFKQRSKKNLPINQLNHFFRLPQPYAPISVKLAIQAK